MLSSLAKAMPACFYFTLLAALYTYISAVIGMHLFGGKFNHDNGLDLGSDPRANFNNFGHACLTIFQILTGENWNDILYNAVAVSNYAAVIYFLLVFLMADLVILNLFLAVILQFFDDGDPHLTLEGAKNTFKEIFCPTRCFGEMDFVISDEQVEEEETETKQERRRRIAVAEHALAPQKITKAQLDNVRDDERGHGEEEAAQIILQKVLSEEYAEEEQLDCIREGSDGRERSTSILGVEYYDASIARLIHQRRRRKVIKEALRPWHYHCCPTKDYRLVKKMPPESSLWIFSIDNPFRKACNFIIRQPWFENFILTMIMLSSVVLAMDFDPSRKESGWAQTEIDAIDLMLIAVFLLEAFLKVIAMGFMLHPRSYLRSLWNWIDFIVVIVSVLYLIQSDGGTESIRVFRVFRALRPLRAIKRLPNLRLVVEAVLACLPSFLNVMLLALMCYMTFAIIAVQLFAGKFWRCEDADRESVCASYSSNYCTDAAGIQISSPQTCVAAGYLWTNAQQNFDNIGSALLTLFEIASLELWLEPLYAAMDLPNSLGEEPIRNQSAWWALYFVVFVTIGSFLIINIFIGVVADNFDKAKQNMSGEFLLTEDQSKFIESLELILANKPEVYPNPPAYDACLHNVRTACYRLVTWDFDGTGKGKLFEVAITALIYINVLVMALSIWNPPSDNSYINPNSDQANDLINSQWNRSLDHINTAFTCIFFCEMCIKLLGYGVTQYFADNWNVFDFTLICLCGLALFMEHLAAASFPLPPQVKKPVISMF